jgi:hypothetical protein
MARMCVVCTSSAVLTAAVCDVSGCLAYIGFMLSVVCFWIAGEGWCLILLGVGVDSTVSIFAVMGFGGGTFVQHFGYT